MKIHLNNDQKVKFRFLQTACKETTDYIGSIRSQYVANKDQYQRLNATYFDLFHDHFGAFRGALGAHRYNSAAVIARTMIEIFFKSYYFEFIEKPKKVTVEQYLDEDRKKVSISKMSERLNNYKHPTTQLGFENHFEQYTKKGNSTYCTLSYFSHGNGQLVHEIYNSNGKIAFSYESVEELVLTIKGMYELLAMLLFMSLGKHQHNQEIEYMMIVFESARLSKGIGKPDLTV